MTKMLNGVEVVPEMENMPITVSLTDASNDISIATIRDVLNDLAFERDVAMMALLSASTLIKCIVQYSEAVSDTGLQLLNSTSSDVKILSFINFAKSKLGASYLLSFNDFSLDVSKQNLSMLQQMSMTSYQRNAKISQQDFVLIDIALHELVQKRSTLQAAAVMLPHDYVKHMLSENAGDDWQSSRSHDEIFKLSISRREVFGSIESNITLEYPVKPIVTSQIINAVNITKSDSIDTITKKILTQHKDKLSLDFLQNEPARVLQVIKNDLVSYSLARCFSVLSSADFFAENVSLAENIAVTSSAKNLAAEIATAYGLPSSIFNNIFETTGISREKLLSLTMTQHKLGSSSLMIQQPVISFGEAELFFDMFLTLPFQVGVVWARIFSAPVADRIVFTTFSRENFDEQSKAKKKSSDSHTTDIVSFDTYSFEAKSLKADNK